MTDFDVRPWVPLAEVRKRIKALQEQYGITRSQASQLYSYRVSSQPKVNNGQGGGTQIAYEHFLRIR